MATANQARPRPRPAHTRGLTFLSYTPDGSRLITVGSNNTIRVYKTGFDGEPTNIDDCPEQNTGLATTNDFFIIGSDDGNISQYSLETMCFEKYLTRCSLPIRDIDLSTNGEWCAVASDEIVVKVIKVNDISSVLSLRNHPKPAKYLSFDPSGEYLALSCTDGLIYIYSLVDNTPDLVRKIDGLIRAVEIDDEICTKVVWHPSGRAFAAPNATRDIQIVSVGDWQNQTKLSNGHNGDISALSWSPNGKMLASAGKDKKILLWEAQNQIVIAAYNFAGVMDLAWHPNKNILCFTNTEGEVYIHNDFVPSEYSHMVSLPLEKIPSHIDKEHTKSSVDSRQQILNGQNELPDRSARRRISIDSLDNILGPDIMDDDNFVVDDDGAGYALGAGLGENKKRSNSHFEPYTGTIKHRIQSWEPQYHESFQPGSTPWVGNRKYLCLNLVGFVWTVDQETHNTVTVEFYDHEFHRDFHFTDTSLYDKACLNEKGTFFSCPAQDEAQAAIFYRPHEKWTTMTGWQTKLPSGEDVVAISLSETFVAVATTANYLRIYTLFGIPYRVYRQKSHPPVTCASWKDYVLTMGNGPMDGHGHTTLLYTIQNIKRDEICQSEDVVALPNTVKLKSVFFSDNGDPFIFDSSGTLLTLLHWRIPSQAQWVPLLDTRLLSRLASGRKTESYFPVAVANSKFHCIILKGGESYPYFPRPLLSEFEFEVPLFDSQKTGNEDDLSENDELKNLEQEFVLKSIVTAQQHDLIYNTKSSLNQRSDLQRAKLEIDKTLLKLLNCECRESEDRGMRALDLVRLFQDQSGRMIQAAMKIADRYDRNVLSGKIREMGESILIDRSDD